MNNINLCVVIYYQIVFFSSISFGRSFERTNCRGTASDTQTLEEDNCCCGRNLQHGRRALQTSWDYNRLQEIQGWTSYMMKILFICGRFTSQQVFCGIHTLPLSCANERSNSCLLHHSWCCFETKRLKMT